MASSQDHYDAILRDPDAPEGYLVLADWLQAQGDVRGEFIQLTFELEREKNTARFLERKRRADELLAAHESKWLGGVKVYSRVWRWGFVWSVTIEPELLDALYSSEAGCLARHVALRVGSRGLGSVERSVKRLASLGSLSLESSSTDEIVVPAVLFSSPHLHLSALSLSGNCQWQLPPADAAAGLRQLTVTNHRLNPHLMRPFLSGARRLTSLTLSGPSTQAFDVFTAAQSFPELERLELLGLDEVDSLLEQLASAPLLAQLQSLLVAGRFSDAGLQVVRIAAARFRHLQKFEIENGGQPSPTTADLRLALVRTLPSLKISKW